MFYNNKVMKKNVNLKIISKQYIETLEPSGEAFRKNLELEDSLEIFTEGTVYNKNGTTYITYNESEETGLQNTRTVVKVLENAVQIMRYSDDESANMDMTLEAGILNIMRFKIPMVGSLDLEVYTKSLTLNLDEEGFGAIGVEYKIKFDEYCSRRTMLNIEVKPN